MGLCRVYVRSKHKAATEAGFRSFEHRPGAGISEEALLGLVRELNADPEVDGVLVQLPLPKSIDSRAIIDALDPAKDVDGFHARNVGELWSGEAGLVPCTPLDRKSTRLNSSHPSISYAVFCLKKKKNN